MLKSFGWGSGAYWTFDRWCLAAIMSSLDSQFLCLGTIFTNDIVIHRAGSKKYTDKQLYLCRKVLHRGVVTLTYVLAMLAKNANVFDLAIWC